jgi:hypothetical protein
MSVLAPVPSRPRWLVTARPGGSRRRYLLHHTVDFAEALRAKAEAQLLLGALLPDQLWLVLLHTLREVG